MNANEFKMTLVSVLRKDPRILGIAQTGDPNAPLVPGKSDIDLFVLCESVPTQEERLAAYQELAGMHDGVTMQVCAGGVWGYGDIFMAGGIDVMPMYFPIGEMRADLDELLAGKRIEKEGRFYPIGRLASIETIHVLYEKENSWSELIAKVRSHPKELFDRWYQSEAARMIDEEDLSRAELRHEVWFFHQVAEEFLDHFLQALYAKNDCYFPSRKRNESAVDSFAKKPADCSRRLHNLIRLAAYEDTIDAAVSEIRSLARELMEL